MWKKMLKKNRKWKKNPKNLSTITFSNKKKHPSKYSFFFADLFLFHTLFFYFCHLRKGVFDQSSPVHPVSESRGGTLSVTNEWGGGGGGQKSLFLILYSRHTYTLALKKLKQPKTKLRRSSMTRKCLLRRLWRSLTPYKTR